MSAMKKLKTFDNSDPTSPRFAWNIGFAFIASLVYFWVLYYIYVYKLRQWEYLGFALGNFDKTDLAACLVFALFPIVLLEPRITRFSTFINWCIYFFIYVPSVLYPVLQGLRKDVLLLSLTICMSFLLIIGIPKMTKASINIQVSRENFFTTFWIAYTLLLVYSVAIFWGSIMIPDFLDVYDQRTFAGNISKGTLVGYSTGILSGCFNPFLMSLGLFNKNRRLFALGIAGQIFVYFTFAMKSVLLSVVVIMILYFLVFQKKTMTFRGIAVFCLMSLAIPLIASLFFHNLAPEWIDNFETIVLMRTYGMVGAVTGTYYDFFSRNPYTFYSHTNIIGLFVTYPYSASIGEILGQSLGLDMNANANFFATDGIAAAGLSGVLLIGLTTGLVLRWFDALIPRHNLRIACLAAVPAVISLANSSFFTTLLTGGLFTLVVFCGAWRGVHTET